MGGTLQRFLLVEKLLEEFFPGTQTRIDDVDIFARNFTRKANHLETETRENQDTMMWHP